MAPRLSVIAGVFRIGRGLAGAAALVLAGLLAWAPPVAAQVYKCVSEDGHVSFQETTCDGMAPGAAASVVPENAWPAEGRHIFWRADSVFGTAYVLGSIHFGTPWIYPLPPVMTDALAASDVLVVEANVTAAAPQQLARSVAARGLYNDGGGLKQALSPGTWSLLENITRTLGLQTTLIRRQKPWLASMTLTAAALRQVGYEAEHGVDVHLMRKVGRAKPVIELESVAQQMEMLSEIPREDQIAMLMQTLSEIKDAKRHFQGMLQAWLQGDAQKLDRILNDSFDRIAGGRRLYKRLIVDRNEAMLRKINNLVREHDTLFVVVGAAHLVGEEGIIERMIGQGYDIEQL